MTVDWILRVMRRDLRSLAEQIEAYPKEADLWELMPRIGNSSGTLALHVAGNIQHYIGAQLGGTGYVRDREREFSARNVQRDEVLAELEAAGVALENGLSGLDDDALAREYPLELGGARLTTGQLLVHLATHLAFHLGQVDYHRRCVSGAGALPGMVSPGELGSDGG